MATDYPFLSRDDLLALIAEQRAQLAEQRAQLAEQRAVIAQLQQRITGLEAQLRRGGGGSSGSMPGTKPHQPPLPPTDQPPRKQRTQGFARQRGTPTATVDHAIAVCPDCGVTLQGGSVQWTREVLELPLAPVQVVEHRFLARECPQCGKRRVPAAATAGLTGKQRFGANTVSLIATLRAAGRMPIAMIQWLLDTVYGLKVSEGGLVGALRTVAQRGERAVTAIRDQVRESSVVHGDETGWREGGKNGYVWTFSTLTERYFVRRGRGKGVVDEVLGERFKGVLVSDFYAAYDHYAGLHQRCWAHLLRDSHDLQRLYPDDEGLAQWAHAVRTVYDRGKAVTTTGLRQRQQEQRRLSRDLLTACRPFVDDALAVQRRLCARIVRYLPELLTFVGDPQVPADNNPAERSLRHLVTQRKISGGTRSPQGTDTTMALATLFGTWRIRGENPFFACRSLLTSPQV
jgi:transposase